MNGTLRIFLAGPGIAKVNHDAIAHALGHESVVAADDRGADALELADDKVRVFRVQARCQPGRIDQVAEHDGQGPALDPVENGVGGLSGAPAQRAGNCQGRRGGEGPAAVSAEAGLWLIGGGATPALKRSRRPATGAEAAVSMMGRMARGALRHCAAHLVFSLSNHCLKKLRPMNFRNQTLMFRPFPQVASIKQTGLSCHLFSPP